MTGPRNRETRYPVSVGSNDPLFSEDEFRRAHELRDAGKPLYEAQWQARSERVAALEAERERLLYIAEHLFQMVPKGVWRDSGGDDMQGHYEGDYHAESLRLELAAFRGIEDGSVEEQKP